VLITNRHGAFGSKVSIDSGAAYLAEAEIRLFAFASKGA
jgi:hypothetical protein